MENPKKYNEHHVPIKLEDLSEMAQCIAANTTAVVIATPLTITNKDEHVLVWSTATLWSRGNSNHINYT